MATQLREEPGVISYQPAGFVKGQGIITATGTAVQLPYNPLYNGVIISAKSTNLADLFVGDSSVTTTEDGTGNGYILSPGTGGPVPVSNTAAIWVNGTAGDIFSFIGS